MTGTVKTTCPYCGVGCGVLAKPRADGSVEIKGDPEHPANFGRLCSKGAALGETLDLEGRLLAPQINDRRVSWDTAINMVADRFSATIAEHGPDSVAFYVSGQILTEDYYVANKLMKGFIGSANIDTNSRLCMASSVAGHRRAFGTDTVPGTYEDLELADVVVLVGSNLLWCHPVLYQRIAAAKATRPHMRVVLVDPRRTKTADLADMHLALEPDSDSALFCGLLKWLDERGYGRPDWIENHTNGFSDARKKAKHWDISAVARATGLAPHEVLSFYGLWADHEKVVTAYSQGVNQSAVGTDKVNAIINCHLATARIGRAGMGPFSLTGQPNAMGGRETGGLANMLAAHLDIENDNHRNLVSHFWNAPRLAQKPGLKAVDMFHAVADGRIKAIWIMATNPVVSMPDADAVRTALKTCPFVVVSDIMASTDTMRYAHVKLPSLGWGEKSGTVTNSERRISRQRNFLATPGNARADWWQLAKVGQAMGWVDAFAWRDASSVFTEFAALTAHEVSQRRDLDLGALAHISSETYHKLPPFQWPQSRHFSPAKITRFFADGEFYTPDRRARFIPVTPPVTAHRWSSAFRLNTGRVRDHWHTMTRTAKAARLSTHMAEPYCEIHPSDALTLKIAHADLVELSSKRGRAVFRALLSPDQKPGNVFVPMHWNDQFASQARVDVLVDPVTDPFSGQPALKGSSVDVKKAAFSIHGFMVSADKPTTDGLDYWALATTDGGWRLEFALKSEPENAKTWLSQRVDGAGDTIAAEDATRGLWRTAAFAEDALTIAVYLSRGPVEVSRTWASSQFDVAYAHPHDRWRVLAGRPAANMPDKGAIVCSCMSVGINQIRDAVAQGCLSVQAVGQTTEAGTNCGSCQAEIAEIIHENHLIAAE